MAVKFERCHVLLPSWPTNSISSGGPEGLLTFEAADGVFPQVFQGRRNDGGLVISSPWLAGRPLMATIECLLSTITLFADPAKESCFYSWAFLSFLVVLDKTLIFFACERWINVGQ